MIAEERLPTLGRRASPPGHILGHAGLSDVDAELEKLAMNSWPSQSGLAILISRISSRISSGTVGRPPRCLDFQAPIRSEPRAVPSYNSVRLNDRKRTTGLREQPVKTNEISRSMVEEACDAPLAAAH